MKLTLHKEIESNLYLKIIYEGSTYRINEFSDKFENPNDIFYIDRLIRKCNIEYKGNRFSYDELENLICNKINNIELSEQFEKKIYPLQYKLFVVDKDYYCASQLIKSAENMLSYGRYQLIEGMTILEHNFNINWGCGYSGLFLLRSIKINNAIM
ncbi:hypothetical protein KQI30_08325 [Clostridium bornimense]|uniref:hypothetical protein n=1 Tax=Clostridium bornimense TaxID=1216932 RepID=UPI001C105068|nr:hypothetical protein [Clostridium bornimense]MBU5316275.1 hypothetical protein [Clostridium bornimense]